MQPINKKAVQKELDLAAEELERHGYVDLANRVDQYASLIMKANKDTDLQELRRGIERVQREAKRRSDVFSRKERVNKKALLQNKLAALRKAKSEKVKKEQLSKSGSEKLAKLIEQARARKSEKSKDARKEDLKKKIRERRLARKRKETEK